jgi:hypothetical protein
MVNSATSPSGMSRLILASLALLDQKLKAIFRNAAIVADDFHSGVVSGVGVFRFGFAHVIKIFTASRLSRMKRLALIKALIARFT